MQLFSFYCRFCLFDEVYILVFCRSLLTTMTSVKRSKKRKLSDSILENGFSKDLEYAADDGSNALILGMIFCQVLIMMRNFTMFRRNHYFKF